MTVELAELPGEHTEAERAELLDREENPYEIAHLALPPGRGPERRFVLRDEGRLIASAGLVASAVQVGGRTFPVVGLGGVLVTRSRRGQGLVHRVLAPALEAAERLGPDFAVLFCIPKRAGLYAGYGFRRIEASVIAGEPELTLPIETMWRPLKPGAEWPPGPVRLLGPMF